LGYLALKVGAQKNSRKIPGITGLLNKKLEFGLDA
jgi:hypothetical protein